MDVVIPHLLTFSLSFHTVEHATAHSPFRVETSDQHLSHHLILTLYFYLGRRPAEFQTFGLVRISCIAFHYQVDAYTRALPVLVREDPIQVITNHIGVGRQGERIQ